MEDNFDWLQRSFVGYQDEEVLAERDASHEDMLAYAGVAGYEEEFRDAAVMNNRANLELTRRLGMRDLNRILAHDFQMPGSRVSEPDNG